MPNKKYTAQGLSSLAHNLVNKDTGKKVKSDQSEAAKKQPETAKKDFNDIKFNPDKVDFKNMSPKQILDIYHSGRHGKYTLNNIDKESLPDYLNKNGYKFRATKEKGEDGSLKLGFSRLVDQLSKGDLSTNTIDTAKNPNQNNPGHSYTATFKDGSSKGYDKDKWDKKLRKWQINKRANIPTWDHIEETDDVYNKIPEYDY